MSLSIILSIIIAVGREIPLLFLLIYNFLPIGNITFAIILLGVLIVKKAVYFLSENYITVAIIREIPLFILLISCLYGAFPLLLTVEALIAFWIEDIGDYVVESLLVNVIVENISDDDMDDFF